jgi:hypothetical protein
VRGWSSTEYYHSRLKAWPGRAGKSFWKEERERERENEGRREGNSLAAEASAASQSERGFAPLPEEKKSNGVGGGGGASAVRRATSLLRRRRSSPARAFAVEVPSSPGVPLYFAPPPAPRPPPLWSLFLFFRRPLLVKVPPSSHDRGFVLCCLHVRVRFILAQKRGKVNEFSWWERKNGCRHSLFFTEWIETAERERRRRQQCTAGKPPLEKTFSHSRNVHSFFPSLLFSSLFPLISFLSFISPFALLFLISLPFSLSLFSFWRYKVPPSWRRRRACVREEQTKGKPHLSLLSRSREPPSSPARAPAKPGSHLRPKEAGLAVKKVGLHWAEATYK